MAMTATPSQSSCFRPAVRTPLMAKTPAPRSSMTWRIGRSPHPLCRLRSVSTSPVLTSLSGIPLRTQKVERHVGLNAHHPTVMGLGRNIEEHPRTELEHPVFQGNGSNAGDHDAHMLDATSGRTHRRAHVFRPAPAGLIGGPADGEAAQPDQLEPALHH